VIREKMEDMNSVEKCMVSRGAYRIFISGNRLS
jgi:hypothetical protein